jgi:hypothetical protein
VKVDLLGQDGKAKEGEKNDELASFDTHTCLFLSPTPVIDGFFRRFSLCRRTERVQEDLWSFLHLHQSGNYDDHYLVFAHSETPIDVCHHSPTLAYFYHTPKTVVL